MEKTAALSKGKVSGPILRGWLSIERGKIFDVQGRIAQHYEDAARFICNVLGYSQADLRLMNCFQFHRELQAADKRQEAERKQAEKWNKSGKK